MKAQFYAPSSFRPERFLETGNYVSRTEMKLNIYDLIALLPTNKRFIIILYYIVWKAPID